MKQKQKEKEEKQREKEEKAKRKAQKAAEKAKTGQRYATGTKKNSSTVTESKHKFLCVSVYVNAYSCLLCTAPADFTEEEVRKFERRLEKRV